MVFLRESKESTSVCADVTFQTKKTGQRKVTLRVKPNKINKLPSALKNARQYKLKTDFLNKRTRSFMRNNSNLKK